MLTHARQILSRLTTRRATPQCRARLERLVRLHAAQPQLQPAVAYDRDFPPAAASIGTIGMCKRGSRSHRLDSCGDFSEWQGMRRVARRYGHPFSVLGADGVQYSDIHQGMLGSCYLLAGLAAIAHAHPEVIEDMFVRRERWQDNVFTTRWLIGGKELLIEVDDMIPVRPSDGAVWFTQPSSAGLFWPMILEKAWAKIHTSYSSIEGGLWSDPVSAMTRSRVRSIYHSNWMPSLKGYHVDSQKELWRELVWATQQNFPMGASSSSVFDDNRKYRVVGHHAYAVFRAYEMASYGKVVEVYNPWNSDRYKGRIPNPSKDDGVFVMALDEYFDAFDTTYIAEVEPSYVVTTQQVLHGQSKRWSHHNFQVTQPGVFYVSISWPSERLMKPCSMLIPDITLQVVKGDTSGRPISGVFRGVRDGRRISSLTATITAGAGNYHVMTSATFDRSSFVDDLFLSVYAPEEINVVEVTGVTEGDRFHYAPWGGTCVAHWVDGELWVRSESVAPGSSSKIWKTTGGGGKALLGGQRVEVLWDDSRPVQVQMLSDSVIRSWHGGTAFDFKRAGPTPIRGSSIWMTCDHSHMHTCGSYCCCDRGSSYHRDKEECRPV